MNPVAERKTAEERREAVLDAAMVEFAARGLHGASTETIARAAGISQPYVFRLFGTKKHLFMATAARCLRETLEAFQRAAEGKRGEEALEAMAEEYVENLIKRERVITRSALTNATRKRMKAPQLDGIIQQLIDSGKVVVESVRKGKRGSETKAYRWAGE